MKKWQTFPWEFDTTPVWRCHHWLWTVSKDIKPYHSEMTNPPMNRIPMDYRPRHLLFTLIFVNDINGLLQDCSNSSALALELLQPCTEPSICMLFDMPHVNLRSQQVSKVDADGLAHSWCCTVYNHRDCIGWLALNSLGPRGLVKMDHF